MTLLRIRLTKLTSIPLYTTKYTTYIGRGGAQNPILGFSVAKQRVGRFFNRKILR